MTRATDHVKEHLAAFVDGELTPEAAAAVMMHLADHPDDQAYVDDLLAMNEALAQAFGAPLNEAVPEAIRNTVLGALPEHPSAEIVPLALWRRPMPLAAGLTLAAALGVAAVLMPSGRANLLDIGPVAAGSALHEALVSLQSGQPYTSAEGSELLILASMPAQSGYCREVEVIDRKAATLQVGLACTAGPNGWHVDVVLTEALPGGTESGTFVPASGIETTGLAPFLDRAGAGMVLEAAVEADLIRRGWTP
jgi:anti-sigma factor RsiW